MDTQILFSGREDDDVAWRQHWRVLLTRTEQDPPVHISKTTCSGADGLLSGRLKTSAAVEEHRANMLGVICKIIKYKLRTAQIIFTCNIKHKEYTKPHIKVLLMVYLGPLPCWSVSHIIDEC